MNEQAIAPATPLKSNRRWLKTVLLNIVTLGIYGLVLYTKISRDINRIASHHDGKKTMHYCLMLFVFTPLTLGIAAIVWTHRISARIGRELKRRELPYRFGAKSFWGWKVLGVLLVGIGPLVYLHKLCKSMNLLSIHYNING
ncbi:MAG: DUF4234 domain-containing protein [Oscillospiraceae bacterium]|nr:DUF4234 domain-containing protein [Oscillospiraceae bacterium]